MDIHRISASIRNQSKIMSTDNTKRLITCKKCGMKFQILDKQIEQRRNTLTCPKCNETIHLANQYKHE